MKSKRSMLTIYLCVILLLGCSSSPKSTSAPTGPSVQFETFDLLNARSVSIAGNANGDLYAAYGIDHSLFVSRSTDAGRTFTDPVLATADSQAHVLSVEKPAIAVDNAGRVGVAWLELPSDFQGADIWYAFSDSEDHSFSEPVLAGTESFGEVAMVQTALDNEGNPYLAWLNGSKLKFTRSSDGGATFSEAVWVGGGSCECCQPYIIIKDENVYIAYRGLEAGGTQGDIRDILLIHSTNSGRTFDSMTRISDTNWHLPACPIAGPSMALQEGNLFVTWMDGRLEPAGTFSRGDAWLASSIDGETSFSPNIRINPDKDSHHTLPSMAIGPGGRIHVAWESLSQGAGRNNLYYTTSDDGGQTFAPPQVIADDSDPSLGNPGKAVLFIGPKGNVTLAWLDRSGAHIASWIDPR